MKQFLTASALALGLAISAFSQTEFLEQEASGIHPYAGLKWNSKIMQPYLGVEYLIEGRAALGFQMGKALKDTLLDSAGLSSNFHSYFLNPYVQFEFLEPDNLNKFSLSLRGDFLYETTPADDSLNGYSHSGFGAGPVVGMRLHAGDQIDLFPQASYELFYMRWKQDWVNAGRYSDETFIQHEITAGINVLYRLTETQGLDFEPKAVLKLGSGRRSSDLFNIDAHIGYFLSF